MENSNPVSESGLYTDSFENSSESNAQVQGKTPTEQVPPANEPQISNQKDPEAIPTLSNVAENGIRYNNDGLHYNVETGEFEPHQDAKPTSEKVDLITTTPERDLSQETREKNKVNNEGITLGGPSQQLTKALHQHDSIQEAIREKKESEEKFENLMNKLENLTNKFENLEDEFKRYKEETKPIIAKATPHDEQDPALAAALDPNHKKPDPILYFEEAKETINKGLNKTQIDFAKQVAEENTLHNPLNNPEPKPNTVPSTTPVSAQANQPELAQVLARLKDLQGQNTPEQKSVEINQQMAALLNGRNASQLSTEEKAKYLDLYIEKTQLSQSIETANQEIQTKRERKEKIIKVAALIAGGIAGIAAAPAVSVAAVVAVTLGGRVATPLMRKFENSLRNTSTQLKYADRNGKTMEQLREIDQKIKRNEWWADRLGEAASVVSWGTAGFGIGVAAHSLFAHAASQASASTETAYGRGMGTQPGTSVGTGTETPVTPTQASSTTDGVLIQDGHVNLPGSAWDGNLAGKAAQDILPGGELNPSNYAGGISEMASRMAENDLLSAGITRQQLLDNLGTSGAHSLINGYVNSIQSGVADPNLADILGKMSSDGAKTLINLINK